MNDSQTGVRTGFEDSRSQHSRLQHSRFGIFSLVLGLAALAVPATALLIAVVARATGGESADASVSAALSAITSTCISPLFALVGLALGIMGVIDRTKKRTFAVIGVSLNSLFMLGGIVLLALGVLMSDSFATDGATAAAQFDGGGSRTAQAVTVPSSTASPAPRPSVARAASAVADIGYSRLRPLRFREIGGWKEDKAVAVVDLVRPANAQVAQWNMFNPEPEPGMQWVLVGVAYYCYKPSDSTCAFNEFEFRLVGRKGKIYNWTMVAGIPDQLSPSQEIFGGGTTTAAVPFMIAKDDDQLVLIWDPGLGRPALYFATTAN